MANKGSTEVKHGSVVAIDYKLSDAQGKLIDESGDEPLHYLHGYGNIVPGLEEALAGKKIGDAVEVSVPADKGYGQRDPKLVFEVPKGELPGDVSKGMRYQLKTSSDRFRVATVTKVKIHSVEVDANHELAGKDLHFAVTIREIRAATKAEMEHGHAHGPGGHHH